MNSEFLPEAEEEFREATMYYETKAPGVGVAFVAEVRRAVRWIIENPYGNRSRRQRHSEQDTEQLSIQHILCYRAGFNPDRSCRPPKETTEVLEGKNQTSQGKETSSNGLKSGYKIID